MKSVFLKKSLVSFITLGPIGKLPASGTCATIFTAALIALFRNSISIYSYAFVLLFIFASAHIIITKCLPYFSDCDPSEIVIDEVVGTLIVFFAIPITIKSILIGVVLFRFFDITKTWPINHIEKHKDAFGVLFDDVMAGLFAHFILRLIVSFV